MRTEEEIAADYQKYRGQCHAYCQAAILEDPTLTLVRGWYFCPIWGQEDQHWWCKKPDGTIVDPTKLQFPSGGAGIYREFAGVVECEQCGKSVKEEEAYTDEHHIFCSGTCYARCVGF